MVVIKKQILVVSNDLAISQEIQENMQGDHTDVSCSLSAAEALSSYMGANYCLVILDIRSSDESGMDLLRAIRTIKYTPILALTDSSRTQDKVALFRAGANSFIEKPVNMQICIAQANALIQLYLNSDHNHKDHYPIIFGSELIISPKYRKVFVDGKILTLTRKEFNLLRCLASYPEQVFSREQLYAHVWDDELAIGGDETVRVHIQKLRKKLTALGKDYIHNIWGVGYKFVPPE